MNNTREQDEVREQFAEADAISRLEGYEPDAFETALKERVITGEIDTEQLIREMVEHVVGSAPPAP
jgi:hypothetical protein